MSFRTEELPVGIPEVKVLLNAENAQKGGVGIDGNRDIDWMYDNTDYEACKAMYGRSWPNRSGTFGLDTCQADYTEEGASGSELLDNAREGNKPLTGKGDPTSPIQTGHRRKPRGSGAF